MVQTRLKKTLRQKKFWFKSTIAIFTVLFVGYGLVAYNLYGWDWVLQQYIGYGVGITGVVLVLLVLRAFGKDIKLA